MNCHKCRHPLVNDDCPQCNPHRLQPGDRVVTPDGSTVTIRTAGYYAARMEDGSAAYLKDLKPVVATVPRGSTARPTRYQQLSLI